MIDNNSLEFIHIQKTIPDPNWHNTYRVHSHHELLVVLSGIMHVSGINQKIELHPGDAALYPAGVDHCERSDADYPVEHCYLVFKDSNLSGNRILVNQEQGQLLRAMASAFYEYAATEDPSVFGNEYLKLMLKIFFTASPSKKKINSMVYKVHSFILQNMAKNIDLSVLAHIAGLSKYHFINQYRHECGKTPVHTLWEMRCSEAVSLLKCTDLSIKEIAMRTGFSNMTHFFHRIKAFSGKSPRRFRSENNGKQQ